LTIMKIWEGKAMDRTIDFTVFCLESYKQAHHLTGKTDLPCFLRKWFMNIVRARYCCTVNPYKKDCWYECKREEPIAENEQLSLF